MGDELREPTKINSPSLATKHSAKGVDPLNQANDEAQIRLMESRVEDSQGEEVLAFASSVTLGWSPPPATAAADDDEGALEAGEGVHCWRRSSRV